MRTCPILALEVLLGITALQIYIQKQAVYNLEI